MHAHMHTCTDAHMHTCVNAYMHAYTDLYITIHAHTHTYIYICIHMYIHIYVYQIDPSKNGSHLHLWFLRCFTASLQGHEVEKVR